MISYVEDTLFSGIWYLEYKIPRYDNPQIFLIDVTQNRPDKKSIIMYVGSLAKQFADEAPSNLSPEVIVSAESVREDMQMPLPPTQNGQVVVHRTQKAFHRTEKTVKRTIVTSTSSQKTVKQFITTNGSTDACEPFISTATMSTSMRHPPTQHSSITVVCIIMPLIINIVCNHVTGETRCHLRTRKGAK